LKKIKVTMGGSGALYPIYLGCLCRLQDEGYDIVKVGGSSGGAISAALWASPRVENTKESLKKFVAKTLPKNNKKVISYSLVHFFRHWGLINGRPLEELFSKILFQNIGEAVVPLEIFVANLQRNKQIIFSSTETPNVNLPKVLRASCSIPLIFDPVEIDGVKYVDGGWSTPLPLPENDVNALGLRVKKSRESYFTTGLIQYIQDVLYKKIETHDNDKPSQNNIVELISEYDRTNLGKTTEEEAACIFDEGYEQMGLFLNEFNK
jgi:hypothetical protein